MQFSLGVLISIIRTNSGGTNRSDKQINSVKLYQYLVNDLTEVLKFHTEISD